MQWNIKEDYFSGQGVVTLAERGLDGKPLGFYPVGNVPELKIAVATSVVKHKESKTGQRATDLRLTTETEVTVTFTMENFNAKNLARVSRGDLTQKAAASITGLTRKGYVGGIIALDHIRVSAVAVKQGATPLVAYTNETTAWDYQVNADAGSIRLNDGVSGQALSALGDTITGVTVGTTTSLAVANSTAQVGQLYNLRGLTGADAATLNGKSFPVASVTSSAVVLSVDTTGKTVTATGAPKGFADGVSLLIDYTYAAQVQVDGLTKGASEFFLRFEGLNTANTDDPNSPVVVEVFRVLSDPFKELALIGDTVQSFQLEGTALADSTRVTGSQYFKVLKLS